MGFRFQGAQHLGTASCADINVGMPCHGTGGEFGIPTTTNPYLLGFQVDRVMDASFTIAGSSLLSKPDSEQMLINLENGHIRERLL